MVARTGVGGAKGGSAVKRIVAALVLLFGVGAGWRLARACAPDFFRAVFTYVRHPDLPRTAFIDGRLGVLQPTFARSYLVIAYRYLNGIGMNAGEREQARDYYLDRSGEWQDFVGTDWPARWRAARARVTSPPAPRVNRLTGGQMLYNPAAHSFALNCADDAFRVALHTLEDRRTRFGAASPAFRSWVTAQDQVFHNCDSDKATIPEAASAKLPALIRADRDYQIAAAQFYAGRYDDAVDGFRRVSRDSASPWSTISRYLVVRTLLRMTEIRAFDAHLESEAQAILLDRKLDPIAAMTWNLVERAGIRKRDPVYFRDLARLLSSKGQGNGLREALWNYTDLYDGVIGDADPNRLYYMSNSGPADPARFRDADLTNWIFHFQSRDPSMFASCLRRWRQTGSPAWLLAALGHTNARGAKGTGLLEAAMAIPEDSPAYLTARFHLLRMELEAGGDRAAVRDGLDALLSGPALKGLPSNSNLFRGLRMLAAPNLEDFVRFVARPPVMVALQMNLGETPGFYPEDQLKSRPAMSERLDSDAARVLNRKTPYRMLKEAALGDSLPAELRREALLTVFTRGLMLGEDGSEVAQELGKAIPEIAPFAEGYLQENDDEGRRFAAAYLLLHRPEARPYFASGISRQSRPGRLDRYRDNWWCPTDIDIDLDSRANIDNAWYDRTPNLLQNAARADTPEFLGGAAGAEAREQAERLGRLHAAGDFLASIVLPYAESHREDARVPEALHWLVRVGEYGCVDIDTWQTTQAAFRVLQGRYPKTTWAKRTPVWNKNYLHIRKEVEQRKTQAQ